MNEKKQALAKHCEVVLESVLGLAFHLLETLRFNGQDPQQIYAVCLYSRLLELASGCKAMLEKNVLVGIPVLLRSMFEADIDLTNLLKCPDYHKRMHASFLEQKIRLTKEAASSRPNPFLADIRENLKPKEDLKQAQNELDKLKSEKNGPIQIRCRAELAGKLDEYLSVYNMLCLDTHNNIRSLENWHIEKTSADEYQVFAFKMTMGELLRHLSAIPSILLEQSKDLANFLEVSDIEFEPYFDKLKAMRIDLETYAKEEANNRIKSDK